MCVNINLTGTAEWRLKTELPDIEIRSESFWQGLCEKNPEIVERNIRQLLEVGIHVTSRLALNNQRLKTVMEHYKVSGSPKYMIDTFDDLSNEEKTGLYDTAVTLKKGQKSKHNPYSNKV